jgi:hypothetical protein
MIFVILDKKESQDELHTETSIVGDIAPRYYPYYPYHFEVEKGNGYCGSGEHPNVPCVAFTKRRSKIRG